ncbi:MAG: polysaccharide deacetylase family protein [Candidatus Scatosoma sp.]
MQYRFMRFPQGKAKAVTLSYDDGTTHDIKLKEIIDKYGVKCTFNINSALVAKNEGEWRLTEKALIALLKDSPHEVAVHGARHIAPGISPAVNVIDDVLSCRKWLEDKFGRIVQGMAYPDCGITRFANGAENYADIRAYLKFLGIVYARSLGADNDRFEMPADWYNWNPTAHHRNGQLFEYLDKFLSLDVGTLYAAARAPRLFYLWGHSFEFARENNWHILETFCRMATEKKDGIWFATNGEIYNYTVAYERLVWNAEGNTVYNPSLFTVFFEQDKTLYSVKAGETLCIG